MKETNVNLSNETLEIMTDFSRINMGLLVRPGKELRTVSPDQTTYAIANVNEEFPKEFAIYDLRQLLNTISLFEKPDIAFGDNGLKISNGTGAKASFTYASKDTIVAPKTFGEVKLPPMDIKFELKASVLEGALKAAAVLELPEIAVIGRKGKCYLAAVDSKNTTAHTWEMPVGDADAKYRICFRVDTLKFLKRDYNVEISSKGIARFVSQKNDVTYLVTATGTVEYEAE
jgi:hypothetical protein